jgi:2-polyprenyl-3-methyl-5-hydroxy-6-metoxy-1,4-benzoquinol methylase
MQQTYESIPCLICGSNNLEIIYEGKGQFGFPVSVSICKDCGFSFLNPRWDESSYLNYYKYDFDNQYRKKKVVIPPERDCNSYYPIYLRIAKHFGEVFPAKILDIGCGDGRKLVDFKLKYPVAELFAIEPSAEYEPEIINRGIQLVSNDVNSAWEQQYYNSFDLIIMRHTLEHFLNPKSVFDKVRKVLKQDGVLYVATPNAYQIGESVRSSFFRIVHPFYYNEMSLKNMLQKEGFQIELIQNGDNSHKFEIFALARKTTSKLPIIIDANNYRIQKNYYINKLKAEVSIKNRFYNLLGILVKIKKLFLPEPIRKRKVLV